MDPNMMIKKTMQQEDLQSFLDHGFDQAKLYGLTMASSPCDVLDFCSSITSPDHDSSMTMNSSDSYFQTMSSTNFINTLSSFDDDNIYLVPIENISQHVEGIEGISGNELDDVLRWWGDSEEMDNVSSEDSMENAVKSSDATMVSLLQLDDIMEEVEGEGETSLHHLLKAYGEAMEMDQKDLANVIIGCISEKASPLGGTIERVAFNLFNSGNQGDYIKQESLKNFKAAFRAFYEVFPYGRFSHFAANYAIVEATMISNSRKVHIIDFDMGEGVQWPATLDAIRKLRKDAKLTSIRAHYEQSYRFEETKRRLLDYANASGLKLEVQEITMEDLVKEIEGSSHEHEFLAFNCMVGLPHMGGRRRNRSELMEFFRVAKQVLLRNEGIITFGDGEGVERTKYCGNYSSFFDEYVTHYHALCESMEESFPEKLTEARIAMESLFVAPYVSSVSWNQKWVNVREDCEFKESLGLMGWSLSKESVMEAKEMVKERESLYSVRVGGQNGNEMVLEWRGTPLVKVSVWK